MKIADSRFKPTFELEAAELQISGGPIAGIDEAGRGPWAGPVVAAAVILHPDRVPSSLDDSKALDAESRASIYNHLTRVAEWGVGIAEVDRIDRDNILQATLWAMEMAVAALKSQPRLALIDGNRSPRLSCETRTIVKGDAKCSSIAAASIIAKVTRDRIMMRYARTHPGYGFERHKGYGTPEHQAAIGKLGVCPLHRRSFKPVRVALTLI